MNDPDSEPVAAIVVAAGSGLRLGGTVPKALREIAGESLLRRSVELLIGAGVRAVVVVIPGHQRSQFERALRDVEFPLSLVDGGAERQDSVRAGLAEVESLLPGTDIVLVHDAARPLVPLSVVRAVTDAVSAGAVAAIPVIPIVDSIRLAGGGTSIVVDRTPLRAVQTPQGFRRRELVAAHELVHNGGLHVTDDAAACEAAGHDVVLVAGSRESLKITEAFDLLLAEAIVASRERSGENSLERSTAERSDVEKEERHGA